MRARLQAAATAGVRRVLRSAYYRTGRVPAIRRLSDDVIKRYQRWAGIEQPVIPAMSQPPADESASTVPASAIEAFNDLQTARIVLNAAEVLRIHRGKMDGLMAGAPPLEAIEALLAETAITDERVVGGLRELVKAAPDFAEAWLELGVATMEAGRFAAAEEYFERCLAVPLTMKVAPDRTGCHVQAALGKARALEAQGKFPDAAKAYDLGLIANGVSGLDHIRYGKLLRQLGRTPESLAHFEAGMSSDVTAVALPSMPRDFTELKGRLKARFNPGAAVAAPAAPPAAVVAPPAVSVPVAPRPNPQRKTRLRLVTVVWGTSFIDTYLKVTARSLLAAGNLAALASHYTVAYTIRTTRADAERLRASPVFKRIQEIVEVEFAVFDEAVIDVNNPSSHWTLWRYSAQEAKAAKEIIFFIIPDMIFAVDTLARWGRLFEKGYRAVCMVSPQVVLETTLTEIEQRFPAGDTPVSMSDAEIHDLLLRQLHPLMIAMYRDTARPSRHGDTLLVEAEGAGLVMRVLASQPFCIDLNHFEVNNAFCPLDRLEDIAYEQPYTVCLEPMLKYPDLYFRKSPRSDDRMSNMGSWIDYHLGPSDVLWTAHNSRFIANGRNDEAGFRRAEQAAGQYVGQMRMVGSIWRVMDAMRSAGCRTAVQILSLANFAARLRRQWRIKRDVTILVPAGDGPWGLADGELNRIMAAGNEKQLRRAIFEHIFPGRLNLRTGDGLSRSVAGEPITVLGGAGVRGAGEGAVAQVVSGPIEVDDCTIYVIDRPLTMLRPRAAVASQPAIPSTPSVLPNRWRMTPARVIGPPPSDRASLRPPAPVTVRPAIATSGTPVALTAMGELDRFLRAYFEEAGKEDASRAGGLNGHLSVARMTDLQPLLSEGVSSTIVSMASLFHRLHYFKDINDRYCDAIGLPVADMPVAAFIDTLTKGQPPLRRAGELYEAALVIEPGNARTMFNLAGVKVLQGATAEADRLYVAAAARDVSLSGYAALRRAAISENAKEWNKAADLYLDAVKQLKSIGEWHENAARCLRLSGRLDEALDQYYLALDWFRRPGVEFISPRPSRLDDTAVR